MTQKLTANDVIAIRDSSDTARVLAGKFGVSYAAIRNVQRRRTWTHINRIDDDETIGIEAPHGRQEQGRPVKPCNETSKPERQDERGKHRKKMTFEISADEMAALRGG